LCSAAGRRRRERLKERHRNIAWEREPQLLDRREEIVQRHHPVLIDIKGIVALLRVELAVDQALADGVEPRVGHVPRLR
jgi:hypothetical protein